MCVTVSMWQAEKRQCWEHSLLWPNTLWQLGHRWRTRAMLLFHLTIFKQNNSPSVDLIVRRAFVQLWFEELTLLPIYRMRSDMKVKVIRWGRHTCFYAILHSAGGGKENTLNNEAVLAETNVTQKCPRGPQCLLLLPLKLLPFFLDLRTFKWKKMWTSQEVLWNAATGWHIRVTKMWTLSVKSACDWEKFRGQRYWFKRRGHKNVKHTHTHPPVRCMLTNQQDHNLACWVQTAKRDGGKVFKVRLI